MRRVSKRSVLGIVVGLLVGALPGSAYALGPAITIGPANSTPSQSAVAVDSSGTAYIAWQVPTPSLTNTLIDFCKVPSGASSCTPVAIPVPAGGLFFDPPTVMLAGGDIYVFEEVDGSTSAQDGLDAWVSSNGGSSFVEDPYAISNLDEETANPVIALPGGNIGNGAVQATGNPQFQANSLASPVQYSAATEPSPAATLNPSPNSYSIGNLGGQFASQLTGSPGILGVFELIETGPCPSGTGLVYAYAPLAASTTGAEINLSTGVTGSPWLPLGGIDCNTDDEAVGGGPSGLGLLETNEASLTKPLVEYRRFTPPSTWSAPVTITVGASNQDSLSQDGSGGVYATWLDNNTGVNLAYSSTGGRSWYPPVILLSNHDGAVSVGGLASSVNGAGQGWAVYGVSGREYAQPFDTAAALPPPPVNTKAPKISGTVLAGKTLSCSKGSWSHDPTSYKYQWYDDGSPIAGATGATYKVTTLEEGTTLTCSVTAANPGGAGFALSQGVKVPVPFVAKCPGATGRLSGTTLGLVKLGASRASEHYLYRHHSDRGKQYEDFFCLTPIGVRVGYGSPKLLKILTTKQRKALKDRVVWASTSNPFYAVDGVRAGEAISVASVKLHTGGPLHIGLNYWYLAVQRHSTVVLKVRGGVVEEIGIATNLLTASAHDQNVLMHSFY